MHLDVYEKSFQLALFRRKAYFEDYVPFWRTRVELNIMFPLQKKFNIVAIEYQLIHIPKLLITLHQLRKEKLQGSQKHLRNSFSKCYNIQFFSPTELYNTVFSQSDHLNHSKNP